MQISGQGTDERREKSHQLATGLSQTSQHYQWLVAEKFLGKKTKEAGKLGAVNLEKDRPLTNMKFEDACHHAGNFPKGDSYLFELRLLGTAPVTWVPCPITMDAAEICV